MQQKQLFKPLTDDLDSYPCDMCGSNLSTTPNTVCCTCTDCDIAICIQGHSIGHHKEQSNKKNIQNRYISLLLQTLMNRVTAGAVVIHLRLDKLYDGYILCSSCHNEVMHNKRYFIPETIF